MPIHCLDGYISAEDRAIMVMSINFSMSQDEKNEQMEYLVAELCKKRPVIPLNQYSLLCMLVGAFLENLLEMGKKRALTPKEIVRYNDLVTRCELLVGKLEKDCAGGRPGDMVH